MVKLNPEYLTLPEVAELTRYKLSHIYGVHNSWRKYGIFPQKISANAAVRYKRSDIVKLMEMQK